MNTVWKFSLYVPGPVSITIPRGAEVVHFGVDPFDFSDALAFWAQVDTSAPSEPREFQVLGTGHEIPTGGRHRGTHVQGRFVWHLYEICQ